MRKLHPDPIVQIHPKTAHYLGIEDGGWVRVETSRGRVQQKAKLFDGIDERVVNAEPSWWFPEMPGKEPYLHGVWKSNINVITNDDPQSCNQLLVSWPLRTALCKIYKIKRHVKNINAASSPNGGFIDLTKSLILRLKKSHC